MRRQDLAPRRKVEVVADLNAADGDGLDMPTGLDSLIEDIPATADLLDTADDAPVIRLINGIIAEAVRAGASDIHLEPFETALTVRMRVDGVLRETRSLNPRLTPLLVSRIKVMARLDIAEKRVPQDGRIPLALTVLQILCLDLLTDQLPALALGAEPPSARAMSEPPHRRRLVDKPLVFRAFLVLGPTEALVAVAAFVAVMPRITTW